MPIWRVPQSGSRRCELCRLLAGRRRHGVGGARLQPSGGQPPPRQRSPWATGAAISMPPLLALPGIRAYTASRPRVRVREDVAVVGYEHRAGAIAASGSAAHGQELQREADARTRGSGVGMEPAPDGSRCRLVYAGDRRAISAGSATAVGGTVSTGRRAGSRPSLGQIARAEDGSLLRSAPETCR